MSSPPQMQVDPEAEAGDTVVEVIFAFIPSSWVELEQQHMPEPSDSWPMLPPRGQTLKVFDTVVDVDDRDVFIGFVVTVDWDLDVE